MTSSNLKARIRDFFSSEFLRFADDYEVYVDYGKGRPVKVKENDATFVDIENFLTNCIDSPQIITNKKSNSTTINDRRNSTKREFSTRSERCTPNKSTFKIGPTFIYDETWQSNKSYNPRVTASVDHIYENVNVKPQQISKNHKLSRSISHNQASRDRLASQKLEKKLYLNIAVNGASKSLRGRVPTSNSDLQKGDFGDDAGTFIENQDFSLVGLADGASGNSLLGINPGEFSRGIVSACRNSFHRNNIPSNQLSRLITSAIKQVQTKAIHGSSTLCLLALDKQKHRLSTLNIGDSGFVIYRNNKIYHRSTCTMYSDGYGPRQIFALESTFGLPCFFDENEILQCSSLDHIDVQKNDIIILSSDGLWDVIKLKQLQKIMERNSAKDLQNLADDLLEQAVGGYAVNNRDDILIIVCRVEESLN